MTTQQRKPHGFTLVDLVIVLVISGALMGLLFPALASPAANAKANTCQDRIRGIGLALRNFELGKREFPPASFNPSLIAFHPADCRPADASGGKPTAGYSWVVRLFLFWERQISITPSPRNRSDSLSRTVRLTRQS